MNVVDATDRAERPDETEPASLLTIILDTNPHAWALLEPDLSLSQAVVSLLVFINAHLAINHANRIAVLASHAERSVWLYPTPSAPSHPPSPPPDDANKYRPFAHIEHTLTTNLRALLASTTTSSLSSSPSTMIAGALTLALTHISKQTPSHSSSHPSTNTQFNYSDPNATTTTSTSNPISTPHQTTPHLTLTPRILILSVSGDLANQYIPLMNCIFACQRLSITIDILKLAGDTVFLQQAADATAGIYLSLSDRPSRAGLLQFLMMGCLADAPARTHMYLPGASSSAVDFRAACFCHRRVVDVGFVCSICLSIFCEPLPSSTDAPNAAAATATCLTCASSLKLVNYGRKPVVVAPVKKGKKKKRLLDAAAAAAAAGDSSAQTSRAATPA